MYLPPKVHKEFDKSLRKIPKCRPIILQCGANTERISWLVDNEAKDLVASIDSFVEDTPDILRYFEKLKMNKDIPSNAKPYSIDIKSMYSNIIIEEGLEAFEEALE